MPDDKHDPDPAWMMPRIEAILVRRLTPEGASWHAMLVASQASHGGTLIFLVRCAQTGQKVAAKIYRRRHLAQAEYQAVQQAVGTAGAEIAGALLADPGIGLIVSDWQEGRNASDLLENEGGDDALTGAGRWLRNLHSASAGRFRVYHPMTFLVHLCDTANAMPGGILPAERGDFLRALSATAKAAALFPPGFFRPVRLHGDFLPQNLIMTPKGVVAIDMLHTRVGSRYDDLASLTVNLALRAEIGSLGKETSCDRKRRLFLSAYGLKGRHAHARLRLAERVKLLKRWQHFANETFPDRPNGLHMIRAIQSIFRKQRWVGPAA